MSRTILRTGLVAVFLVACAMSAFTQPKPVRRPTLLPGIKPIAARVRPDTAYSQFLQQKRVPANVLKQDMDSFKALPPELRELIVSASVPDYALPARRLPVQKATWIRLNPDMLVAIRAPTISWFFPEDASKGEFVIVGGSHFRTNTKVYFNGSVVPSFHWTFFGIPMGTMMGFQIPSTGVNYGSSYPVQLKTGGRSSSSVNFTVIAPRAYRGYHGWKVSNRGGPNIKWAIYRNYFGADAVEFADGTHRPAAQDWYNTRYRGVGGGGNCYGMSLMSVRGKQWNIAGLLHETWWTGSHLSSVWKYNTNRSNDQVWESVLEMQGAQISEPQCTLTWDRVANQSANAAWQMARGIVGQPAPHGCWMGMVGGGGHAVIVYDVGPDAASRNFLLYDNNNPYATTETDGPDASVAVTNKAANTFSYGGYNQVAIADLTELLVPPNLPTEAGGPALGAADRSSYLAVSRSARVVQITDERGNMFYSRNRINRGRNRIPGAVYMHPFMGGPVPADYPRTWLFMNSNRKSYTVQIAGQPGQPTSVNFVQKGLVLDMVALGADISVTGAGVNTGDPRFVINNPSACRPQTVKLIASVGADEERTFEVRGINRALTAGLEIGLEANRSALRIVNRSPQELSCQVLLRTDAANRHTPTRLMPLRIAPSQTGILRPPNWRNIRGQSLRLELQSLTGARLEMQQIRP